MTPNDQTLAPQSPLYFTKLSAYRTIIAVLLFVMHFIEFGQPLLGAREPNLYILTLLGYTILNTVLLLSSLTWTDGRRPIILLASLFLDIAAIYLLKYASTETGAMLSLLLVVVIVVGVINLSERMALLVTAMATIAIIGEKISSILANNASFESLFDAGTYGTVFFLTFILVSRLVARTQSSETIVSEQAADISRLEEINHRIVEKMQTGILVIDSEHKISTTNRAAKRLIKNKLNTIITESAPLPKAIEYHLQEWLTRQNSAKLHFIKDQHQNNQLKLNFLTLDETDAPSTLIFIEDMNRLNQQAQSLKLNSLGRLAGSIAHEIRNPLNAISHASQLLNEKVIDDQKQSRLTEIIINQSQRIDSIVENVSSLSRRNTPNIEGINLNQHLQSLIQEYTDIHNTEAQITFSSSVDNIVAHTDKSQLNQVLHNLIENGLRYSYQNTNKYTLQINLNRNNDEIITIDIIDNGPGIPEELVNKLFEPFFTSEHDGSGLGLYIAREICEANHLSLSYNPTAEGETCFTITFPHPLKEI